MLSFERPARIFLADEHPIFLAGLRFCLAEQPEMAVVGEVHSSADLAKVIEKAAPDVAVVGDSFNGISVVESLLNDLPSQRLLVVAEELDNARAHRLLAFGVRGYVRKQSPGSVVCKAIATVLRGGCFLDSPDSILTVGGTRRSSAPTEREQEVLRLIALGFSIREAAARIGITTKSAETYKARASSKLSIDSRQQIVQYAITQGWFSIARLKNLDWRDSLPTLTAPLPAASPRRSERPARHDGRLAGMAQKAAESHQICQVFYRQSPVCSQAVSTLSKYAAMHKSLLRCIRPSLIIY